MIAALRAMLNPWLLLGLLAAFAGVYTLGRTQGGTAGENRVQTRWDAESKQRALEGIRARDRVLEENDRLQALADERKLTNARTIQALADRTAALTLELSKRPARSDVNLGVAKGAGFGTNGWGTGAGLLRDDAMLLAGKADLWQRIRLQRDECYRQYNDLAATLERLRTEESSRGAIRLQAPQS